MGTLKNKKLTTFRNLVLLGSVLLAGSLTACTARIPHFAIIPKSQAFKLAGSVNKKVDILWVIDNSGTMGPKQDNLRTSINSFMSQFMTKNFDFRIAVTTTDIRPADPTYPDDPNYSGQGACLVGSPTIVIPSTPSAASTLGFNADVGFFGSADAHGLDAARLALSSPNANSGGCTEGFLRSDAFLAVIVFSDADDSTGATVNELLSHLDEVKPPTTSVTGATLRQYSVSAMVVEDLSRQACVDLGPFSEVGYKFLDAANLTGGAVASICDPDFSAGLISVSTKILESATAINLIAVPNPSTIIVTMNGEIIPQSSANGWTFDSVTNSIYFHGTAIPSGDGVSVNVAYTPIDIVR